MLASETARRLTIAAKGFNDLFEKTIPASIASEGQQPTLNDQGVTVAKRVSAGRATVQTMTMEELHRHAFTCRNGKQDWHHNSGKGDQVWQTFSEP